MLYYTQGWIMTFWGSLANEIMEPPSYSPAPVLNIFYLRYILATFT